MAQRAVQTPITCERAQSELIEADNMTLPRTAAIDEAGATSRRAGGAVRLDTTAAAHEDRQP